MLPSCGTCGYVFEDEDQGRCKCQCPCCFNYMDVNGECPCFWALCDEWDGCYYAEKPITFIMDEPERSELMELIEDIESAS